MTEMFHSFSACSGAAAPSSDAAAAAAAACAARCSGEARKACRLACGSTGSASFRASHLMHGALRTNLAVAAHGVGAGRVWLHLVRRKEVLTPGCR